MRGKVTCDIMRERGKDAGGVVEKCGVICEKTVSIEVEIDRT